MLYEGSEHLEYTQINLTIRNDPQVAVGGVATKQQLESTVSMLISAMVFGVTLIEGVLHSFGAHHTSSSRSN